MNTLHSWAASFAVYKNPKVVAMLFLGFSAGLPLLLVFGTLSAWLRVEGVDKTTIGFVSWVALAYGLKFAWAPLVDRVRLPLLTRALGQRRSWMLLAQAGVITGLLCMASYDPLTSLGTVVLFAVVTAFSSATQDITIDAWRIEAIADDYQGAMAGAYQLGYRLGMIVAGGGAFSLAHFYSWPAAYVCMAVFMLVGVVTVLVIAEPEHGLARNNYETERKVLELLEKRHYLPEPLRRLQAWFIGAVVSPFADFFARYGGFAIIILGFIMVFRLSDITLGVMANPFYIDMQYSELEIGLVTKTVGPIVTIIGALFGGVLVARYGTMRMLMIGALLVIITNLLFAWLATQPPLVIWLALVVGADNIAAGIAGTTFIAYLSGLTNKAYTATQYALFSSIMLLLAKFIAGFSGLVVDATSYPVFFLYAATLGLPSVVLILALARHERNKKPVIPVQAMYQG
ncbi:MAG: AmpG family muropeptide MFS transporter [Gammaproteobacteria bacterium]